MTTTVKIIIILFAYVSIFEHSYSQVNNSFIIGSPAGQADTMQIEKAFESIRDATGLLEREIEPDKYIVGQNDEFTISILTARSRHFDVKVSPDGSMLIPSVGRVDLKGKTLAESYVVIENLIKKNLTGGEVNVVLKNLRRFKVSISGLVAKSGIYPATAADRISEIIDRAGGLSANASLRNIILIRKDSRERLKIDLLKYYRLGCEDSNPNVLGGDIIIVPQSNENSLIGLFGEVFAPGTFEFADGDSLSTLLKFGLGFHKSALLDSVEFVRSYGKGLHKEIIDLSKYAGNDKFLPSDLNFPLLSGDRVYVRKKTDWHKLEYVVVTGEVQYPGYFAISENSERISDIIQRFGGFTKDAAVDAVEYIRQSELDVPDTEMERLSRILPSEMSESESRYYQARKLEKRGVMSIDFSKILNEKGNQDNIIVMHRDSIIVPSLKNFVNVQGRVVNPGLIIYKPGADYMEYIELAGGFGFRADDRETILNKSRGGLFRARDRNYIIEPGDVILVPPEKELTFMEIFSTTLTIVTQVLTIAGVMLAISNMNK